MEHVLKTWPVLFDDVKMGSKTFEIRENDRNFKVGDTILLKEYIPEDSDYYTGEEIIVSIDYIISLDGLPGFPDGFVGMSISVKE